MLLHYLKSSFRYMRKFALQNIISMVGLAAGFVAYAFSSLWTGYVNSYDTFHKDADRIYTFAHHEDGKTTIGNERARAGNGDAFYILFREFERRNMLDSLGIESTLYSYFQEYQVDDKGTNCLDIDSAFLDFFNPVLVAGDWSFLQDVGKIAVSKSYAQKEYGDDNPIGKEITVRRDHYTVGAVIEDYDHSFLEFDLMRKWNQESVFYYNWLFFKLQGGISVQNMLDRCETVFADMFEESMTYVMRGKRIVPLKEIYKNLEEADAETFVKYDGLELLSKASLLILLCAIVNHFTFFLNYLKRRRREMSLRKVCGASTGSIATQMVFESSIPVIVSLLMGLWVVMVLKKPYMRLADVYLMYAEARAALATSVSELSEKPSYCTSYSAIDAINVLRDRVNSGDYPMEHVPGNLRDTREHFIDEVRRERAVELSFEGFRWNDLQRWLLLTEPPYTVKYSHEFERLEADSWFKDHDPKDAKVGNFHKEDLITRRLESKHYWFPLPDKDIYLYHGFNQNPGW